MLDIKCQSGQSILEVIIAVAIFSLIAAAMVAMLVGGLKILEQGGGQTQATALAQEGIEAIRSIRDGAWNELVFNQVKVFVSGGQWVLTEDVTGEGEDIFQYNRVITLENVCRNSETGDIVDCPGDYIDVHSKKVNVRVEWEIREGVMNSVERTAYLTNWDSKDWVQTDWSGGNGQDILSDPTKFWTENNIDYSRVGEIKLKGTEEGCSGFSWSFNTPSNYTYDPSKIEVVSSLAQLKTEYEGCIGTALTCDSFFDQISCENQQGCSWLTPGYPTDNPSINPIFSYNPSSIDSWTTFVETASKNGGEIYYQISDDDGTSWYYWDGLSWSIAGEENYNTALVVNENLWKFNSQNKKIMFKAFLESDGTQKVQLDEISVGCANLQMEAGSEIADENWVTVNLENTYNDPVLVASYQESNNSLPASVRIRNLDSDSFEVRLQNPGGDDLMADEITYLVIEEGRWEIDGIKLEAHRYDTNTIGYRNNWNYDEKTFDHDFSVDPIVLHQVMTYNDPNWITTYVSRYDSRMRPPDTQGVRIALNGAEAVSSHGTETIGWIAIEMDKIGIIGGVDFETFRTPDSVRGHDNGCYNFNFQNSYSLSPLVLGFQQEMDGNDGGWSVVCSKTTSEAGFHVEEDQESDGERRHSTETFGFIVFASPFAFSSGVSGGGYPTSGTLESSAFNTDKISSFQAIEWDEVLPSCTPSCEIKFQIKTAPDNSGLPGIWSDNWSGPEGEDGDETDYFTISRGELIHQDHNGDQWIKYRVILSGDGANTPVLKEVRINHK